MCAIIVFTPPLYSAFFYRVLIYALFFPASFIIPVVCNMDTIFRTQMLKEEIHQDQ
jgi:hypothetical protein